MFLMRCLFTMFAEDVELLPEDVASSELLERLRATTRQPSCRWSGSSGRRWTGRLRPRRCRAKVQRFNGEFFEDAHGAAARPRGDRRACGRPPSYDWSEVEPAIFGTLLEQALDPAERTRLGAHYTPRAYVERLVVATVIEPLREDWRDVPGGGGDRTRRRRRARARPLRSQAFHDRLCATRVLDPACGTGNFLYVALELMKRLEGEVLEALPSSAARRRCVGSAATPSIRTSSSAWRSIRAPPPSPSWCCGSAICNGISAPGRRAARADPAGFENIAGQGCGADLGWLRRVPQRSATASETYAEPAPAGLAGGGVHRRQSALHRRQGSARRLGRRLCRSAVGGASADERERRFRDVLVGPCGGAADPQGTRLRRFGFVTTNSITPGVPAPGGGAAPRSEQAGARWSWRSRIIPGPRRRKDAAAVRIAMTVVEAGTQDGRALRRGDREEQLDTDAPQIGLCREWRTINSDLTIGVDVTRRSRCGPMKALSRGVKLAWRRFHRHAGTGRASWAWERRPGLEKHHPPLSQRSRPDGPLDAVSWSSTCSALRPTRCVSDFRSLSALLRHVKPRDATRKQPNAISPNATGGFSASHGGICGQRWD